MDGNKNILTKPEAEAELAIPLETFVSRQLEKEIYDYRRKNKQIS